MGWIRAILFLQKAKEIIKINSRSGKSITHRYPEVLKSAEVMDSIKCKESVILDGEIVVLDKEGYPDFQSHQRRMNVDYVKDIAMLSRTMPSTYYVFDILYFDGKNIQDLEFTKRREILSDVVQINSKNDNKIRISDFIEEKGIDIFKKSKSMNLEGIVAKNKYGKYVQGARFY